MANVQPGQIPQGRSERGGIMGRYTKSDYRAADRSVAGKQFYDYSGELEAARRKRWLAMPINRQLCNGCDAHKSSVNESKYGEEK